MHFLPPTRPIHAGLAGNNCMIADENGAGELPGHTDGAAPAGRRRPVGLDRV